jgi:secondary thiamine-phosphate synthase enzyme
METFQVRTPGREGLVDITREVARVVADSGIDSGICTVFIPHTTAAVTINENADPTVQTDIIRGMQGIGIEKTHYQHMEGNSPAHIKSSLFGFSEQILVEQGRLVLGTWQGIYFCEFDGPRTRKVHVKVT